MATRSMTSSTGCSRTDIPGGSRAVPPKPQYVWTAAKSSIHVALAFQAFLVMAPVSQPQGGRDHRVSPPRTSGFHLRRTLVG
jgi:hypothetical protein